MGSPRPGDNPPSYEEAASDPDLRQYFRCDVTGLVHFTFGEERRTASNTGALTNDQILDAEEERAREELQKKIYELLKEEKSQRKATRAHKRLRRCE